MHKLNLYSLNHIRNRGLFFKACGITCTLFNNTATPENKCMVSLVITYHAVINSMHNEQPIPIWNRLELSIVVFHMLMGMSTQQDQPHTLLTSCNN